jgi:iron complex outermembrane receptor protein
LNRNWASVYTVPQTTQNQLAFLTARGSWNPIETLSLQGNVYYRGYWQRHVDSYLLLEIIDLVGSCFPAC